jgi:hypothetical protein
VVLNKVPSKKQNCCSLINRFQSTDSKLGKVEKQVLVKKLGVITFAPNIHLENKRGRKRDRIFILTIYTTCSFDWWLVLICSERKVNAAWLLMADLFREESTVGW